MKRFDKKFMFALSLGGLLAFSAVAVGLGGVHYTESPDFCMSCHEMRVVGEQGWMRSPHYHNSQGVVAVCTDCHVPPELPHMLWVKTRDGVKDVVVHFVGESNPREMDWEELRMSARAKIHDSSCQRCHQNLTPRGARISVIVAHREFLRMREESDLRCVDCHRREFHRGFREYLERGADGVMPGG